MTNIDKFSFFFAFYGLILGLAVTELLGGFAGMVRAKALKQLELQTALLAILIFVLIVATWVDAFNMMQGTSLNLEDLWSPILLATLYFVAAAVVFPREAEQFDHLRTYFAGRKKFIIGLLFAAEVADNIASLDFMTTTYREEPTWFWAYLLPYNIAILGCFAALLLVQSRRANIGLLAALIALFVIPYWHQGAVDRFFINLFS